MSRKRAGNGKQPSLCVQHFDRGEGEGEDGDVVLLAVSLGCGCYGFGGLAADGSGAVKAKKFAGGGLGFEDAVGEEGDFLMRFYGRLGFGVD